MPLKNMCLLTRSCGLHSERRAGQFYIANVCGGEAGEGKGKGKGQAKLKQKSKSVDKGTGLFILPCCAAMYISHLPSLFLSACVSLPRGVPAMIDMHRERS